MCCSATKAEMTFLSRIFIREVNLKTLLPVPDPCLLSGREEHGPKTSKMAVGSDVHLHFITGKDLSKTQATGL